MEHLIKTTSLIITLDVDTSLFDKLKHIEQAGFSTVEINTVEPTILIDARSTYPNLRLGVGNILNTEQLEQAITAGADFGSSPGFIPALVQTAALYHFHYLPGVATFSEAMEAAALGCQHMRPFPATRTFCTHLSKYLPNLRLFPAEINLEDAECLLNLPTVSAASILNPNLQQLEEQLNSPSTV